MRTATCGVARAASNASTSLLIATRPVMPMPPTSVSNDRPSNAATSIVYASPPRRAPVEWLGRDRRAVGRDTCDRTRLSTQRTAEVADDATAPAGRKLRVAVDQLARGHTAVGPAGRDDCRTDVDVARRGEERLHVTDRFIVRRIGCEPVWIACGDLGHERYGIETRLGRRAHEVELGARVRQCEPEGEARRPTMRGRRPTVLRARAP